MGAAAGALLLFVVASLAATRPTDASETPSFCRTYDCPKYALVKKYDTFEERNYESSRWVSTQVMEKYYEKAIMVGFLRLYRYIDGKNSAGMKIPMTVPVIAGVVPEGKGLNHNITMSFFVPFAVENPPEPLNPALYFATLPAQTVYVKSFSGFASKSDYIDNAKSLSEDLKALGKPFQEPSFYTAGYDAPFTLFNRHNEAWIIAA